MIRSFRYLLFLLCYLISHLVQADAILIGSMTIGDDNTAALPPTTLFSYSNSSYSPSNPIHFNLSQSGTVTGVTLNQASSFNYGATFVVWNSNGNVVINTTASDNTPANITGTWSLAAGDYQMAVFGACVQKSGNVSAKTSISSCINPNGQQQWQDISFTNITLSGVNTSSVNFIQRQHIGDTSNMTRIYPPSPSGSSVTYNFTISSATSFSNIVIHRLQDYDVSDDLINFYNDKYKIRIKKTSSVSYDFEQDITSNDDLSWTPNLTLSAGSYQLIIQPTNGLGLFNWYYDDIAWDDIVLKAKPISATDHYQLEYTSNNISCLPTLVTIKACSNSGTTCTVDTTANSSVTLTASPASAWGSNPVALVNGVASVSLSHYVAENVLLGVSNSTPVCLKDGVADASCQTSFVSSTLLFDIPTFYSGSHSGNVTLKAIKADGTNTCSALFTGLQPILFTNSYITPSTGSLQPQVINTSTAAATPISSNTSVPLTFDGSGVATFQLAYNDAGVLNIIAKYIKTDANAGTLTVSGSDNVAVLPSRIQLTAVGQTACSGTNDDDYSKCTVYKKAGETFTLSAQAGYGSSFVSTNNFTPESTAVKPLIEHKLLAPSAGTLPSSWTNTALTFSAGTASSSVSEGDVGVYKYQVNPFVPYPTYQDEATQLKVPKSTDDWSDPVGRFVPAQLKATVIANGSLTTDTCANQTSATLGYSGQALRFATGSMLSVTALGSDGSTEMKNYQGAFAKITGMKVPSSAKFVAAMIPKNNTNALTSTASWSDGTWTTSGNAYTQVYTFSANNQFTFGKTNTPVTPFETSLVVSTLTDSDDVKATSSLPLTFNPVSPDASAFKVYSGRLTLESVNGAENNGLALPFYMQYWNGSAYAINSADNCSTLATNYLSMNAGSSWSGIALRTSSSTTSTATTSATLSPAVVTNGVGNMLFSAPNATGWVDIAASASFPLWMQDLSQATGLNPARANFGFYRGNDRVIYRREVFSSQ